MQHRIPFNRANALGKELDYVRLATESGKLCGDGPFSAECHTFLEATFSAARALLTTSCTHALEMTAFLLDIGPGDEVIVPSFTFVSTINAYVLRGAKPVFADIRADTLNLDENQLERLITPRTKAIVPVHYAGVGCEMNRIMEIADRHGVTVIEDNAHGLFGKYRGKLLGSFAPFSTLSFHETKNFTCGEGGALIINDPQYIERAEILREKGTNRSRFFRGQIDKYSWVDVGSSYLPADINAAFLLGQLQLKDRIQSHRRGLWNFYRQHLEGWATENRVTLPHVPVECEQAYHMFYLLTPSLKDRQQLIRHLESKNIASVFHYLPLHTTEMGMKFGGKKGDCPVTENLSDRLLRLPFFNTLEEIDQKRVVDAIREVKF